MEVVWPSLAGVLPPLGLLLGNSAPGLLGEAAVGPAADSMEVEVTTPSRGVSAFLVVWAKFKGRLLLQRPRLVNTDAPHFCALEQKTMSPELWAFEQQK